MRGEEVRFEHRPQIGPAAAGDVAQRAGEWVRPGDLGVALHDGEPRVIGEHGELAAHLGELFRAHAHRGVDGDEELGLDDDARRVGAPGDLADTVGKAAIGARPGVYRGAGAGDEEAQRSLPVEEYRALPDRAGELFEEAARCLAGEEAAPRILVVALGLALLDLIDGLLDQLARVLDGAGIALAALQIAMIVGAALVIVARALAGARVEGAGAVGLDEAIVALDRALPGADPDRRVRLPEDRVRQRLLDVLVGRHLEGQIHQLGLVGLGELGVPEVAKRDVMNLVEEHAAEILGLGQERIDVDVEIEIPVVERNGHALDRGIGDGVEPSEDGGVVGIALEEAWIAEEGVEPGAEIRGGAHCGLTGVIPSFFSVATSKSAWGSGSWGRSWPRQIRTTLLRLTSTALACCSR